MTIKRSSECYTKLSEVGLSDNQRAWKVSSFRITISAVNIATAGNYEISEVAAQNPETNPENTTENSYVGRDLRKPLKGQCSVVQLVAYYERKISAS